MVHDGLTCAFDSCHMGNHAEYTAGHHDVSRSDQDAYAVRSQLRTGSAVSSGYFEEEIIPVTVAGRRENVTVSTDEGPRSETTIETLAKLQPVFENDGTVTAGNASTLADGAAAIAVVSEAVANQADSDFRFEILGSGTSGTAPRDLFIAPIQAVRDLIKKCDVDLDDVDLFEINEAFAAQIVACIRQLEIDPAKVNVHGGAISLGHPIGASGARTLVTLLYAMKTTRRESGAGDAMFGRRKRGGDAGQTNHRPTMMTGRNVQQ